MLLPSSRLGAVCQRPREVMRVQNLTLDSARKRVSVTLRQPLICYRTVEESPYNVTVPVLTYHMLPYR
jgi:hypothetical protein